MLLVIRMLERVALTKTRPTGSGIILRSKRFDLSAIGQEEIIFKVSTGYLFRY